MCDEGWSKNTLYYGGGLMIMNADLSIGVQAYVDTSGMVGHGGATYGFKSMNGYYPHLGFGLSLLTHEDIDARQPTLVWCYVTKALMEAMGKPTSDVMCLGLEPAELKYSCQDHYGDKVCSLAYR